jgi:pimeloyl-ACP methyl ester carboxylesterase
LCAVRCREIETWGGLLSPRISKLVLAAPAGLFLDQHPTLDIFATTRNRLLKDAFHDPESEAAKAFMTPSADPDAAAEQMVALIKALAAAGRFLWPNGDRDQANASIVSRRRHYWSGVNPTTWFRPCADAFKRLLTGSASVKVQKISAAGHALFAEQPKASAAAIIDFCAY